VLLHGHGHSHLARQHGTPRRRDAADGACFAADFVFERITATDEEEETGAESEYRERADDDAGYGAAGEFS
jgi:hypothetical protein